MKVTRYHPQPRRRAEQRHAIALPPPIQPLPLVLPLLLSFSALLLQNARTIAEALLTRHLRTRTTIARLSITPFGGHVRGIRLSDDDGGPLLTADALSVRVTKKKQLNFGIVANGITLHADIKPANWGDSNWHTHLSRISDMDTDKVLEEHAEDTSKSETEALNGRCAVSLTTKQTAIHIMKPSLRLSLPPLVIPSTDLSSIASIHRLIDGLLGKAARDAGTRSFPRELRMGARRAARGVAVKAVENVFVDVGRRVAEWRRRVDEAGEFVKDLPDIDKAQRVIKDVGGILRGLENILKWDNDTQKGADRKENDALQGFRELDEGDAEQ